jgi:nucleoid-associated protein YgaU
MPSAPQLASRPASPQSATPRRVIHQRIFKIIFSTALIASVSAFIAPRVIAHDLGEIARQERAKKQNNPAPPATHVYTNEDVKREEILTPEDKARFSATTKPESVKPAQPPAQLASLPTPPPVPQTSAPPTLLSPTNPPPARVSAASAQNPQVIRANNPASAPSTQTIAPAITATVPTSYDEPVATTVHTKVSSPTSQPIVTVAVTAPPQPTVPLDQMPLGDVARYYRAKKQQNAEASAKASAASNPVSASTLAPTVTSASASPPPVPQPIPTADATPLQLSQMSLGDVARYYRAKKREQDAAIATADASPPESNPVPSFSAAPVQSAPIQSPTSGPSKASSSPYLLAITAMPLASMKPPTPSPNSPRPASSIRWRSISVVRRGNRVARPDRSEARAHAPNARKSPIVPTARPKHAASQPLSLRISSGDTLWQLARRYLGSGTRWHELIGLNPNIEDPRRLQIGAQLLLPQ